MSFATSVRWIDRPSVDLPWFIGAALLGWVALFAHVLGGVPAIGLLWVWILFFDGPHLFATLTRTYFDKAERASRKRLLLGSLAWCLPPFGTLGWGVATGNRLPWFMFLAVAQVWAYWHVVRQHYGFLVLYQRKAGEPAGLANRIDYAAFYLWMLAPFVSFALRHPSARKELGLPAVMSAPEATIVQGMLALTGLAFVLYAGGEIRRVYNGAPWNVTKNLFLAACVPLHVVTLLHPSWSTSMELLALPVIVTAYHNVQYNGIVWSYARKRYAGDADGAKYGAASRWTRNVFVWYAMGLLFAFVGRYASWSLDGRYWPFTPSTWKLGGVFTATDLVNAWWWFVAIHHYYLDQKIWRVSRDRDVQQNLGLAAA